MNLDSEIVNLYKNKIPVKDIMSKTGKSYSQIYNILRKNDVELRRKDGTTIRKSDLIKLYLENNLNLEEVSDNLNTTVDDVKKALIRYNLDQDILLDEDNNILNRITPLQEQLIYGSLLGDASISLHHGTPRIKFEHSHNQYGYLIYKYNILKNFCSDQAPQLRERFDKRTNKYYCYANFKTKSLAIFKEIHDIFYKPKKTITIEILNKLDDRGLAFWFMDDGYKYNYNGLGFSTDCFSEKELEVMLYYFKVRWNLTSYVKNKKHLIFNGVDAYYLQNIMKPYIREEFHYKLL